jgi:hypothetical protein
MTASRSRTFAALAAATFVAVATAAHADPSTADATLAEALFRDGRQLAGEGRYAEACPKFAESQRLAPALGTLLNLAVCHEKQGKVATAWAEFSTAAGEAARAGEADREQFARDHVKDLELRLPKLLVVAQNVPPGFEVRLDGVTMTAAALGSALPIDPGDHQLAATAPHKNPGSVVVRIPGAVATTTVRVPALADAAVPAPAAAAASPGPVAPAAARTPDKPTTNGSSGLRTLGWVSVGVGAVGVVAGTYFGAKTFSKKHEADPYCGDNHQCDARGNALIEDARSSATLSTISFGVGAVGLVAGAWLLLTSPPAAEGPKEQIIFAPYATPSGGGVGVSSVW